MTNAEILGRIYAICSSASKSLCNYSNFFSQPQIAFSAAIHYARKRGLLSGYADVRIGELINNLPADLGVSTPMTHEEQGDFALGYLKELGGEPVLEKAEMTVDELATASGKSKRAIYNMARSLGRLPTLEEIAAVKMGRPKKYN